MIRLRPLAVLAAFALILCAAPLCASDHTFFATRTEITERAYGLPEGTIPPARYVNPEWLKMAEKPMANDARGITSPGADSMLHGPNRLSLTVLDARTSQPVTEYQVQSAIVVYQPMENKIVTLDDSKPNPLSKLPMRCAVLVGQLESKTVQDASGSCRFDGLGTLDVEFQIRAKGYLACSEFVHIPAAGPVTVKLVRTAVLTGRIVNAASGQPWPNLNVALTSPGADEAKSIGLPVSPDFQTTTDREGRFTFDKELPPARFQLTVVRPEKPFSLTYRSTSDVTTAAQPMTDKLGLADLRKGGVVDLGTFKVASTPVVEVTLFDPGQRWLGLIPRRGAPRFYYPFEYELLDGRGHMGSDSFKGATDAYGKARLALTGWKPGQKVAIYFPGRMGDYYQAREVGKINKDESITTDEGVFYDHGFYDNELAWHSIPPVLGLKEGADTPKWKDLTPAQKDKIRKAFKGRIEALQARARRLLARKEHPNCLIVTPNPSGVTQASWTLRPMENELTISRMKFVDQVTRKPLQGVLGFASELDMSGCIGAGSIGTPNLADNRECYNSFYSDEQGKANVSRIMLSAGFLKREKELNRLGRGKASSSTPLVINVAVRFEGYLSKMFAVPIDQIHSGRKLVFEMEPEARVRGRFVLPDGQPLTVGAFRNYLARHGLSDKGIYDADRPWVHILNWGLQPNQWAAVSSRYIDNARTQLDDQGRFEFKGLCPHPDWLLQLRQQSPSYVIRHIALKPGDNDLGDLVFPFGGSLAGRVTGEDGKGIEGVGLMFANGPAYTEYQTITNSQGNCHLDLMPFRNSEQIVRLMPPWGYESSESNRKFLNNVSIMFESVRKLDLATTNTFNACLRRGHALKVEIAPGPARDAFFRYYNESPDLKFRMEDSKETRKFHFVLATLALQGLDPEPGGFTYLQRRRLTQGLVPTSGPLCLQIDNVPPGRYALRLDGAYYYTEPTDSERRSNESMQAEDETYPLVFAEVEMKATTTTARLDVSRTRLEVELNNRPPQADPNTLGNFILLERKGVISTWRSENLRDSMTAHRRELQGDYIEKYQAPLLDYAGFFLKGGSVQPPRFRYQPAVLPGIPPGEYRLEAYHEVMELDSHAPKPYYETTVKVPAGVEAIKVSVPYERYSPALNAPRPLAQ